jgi:hypothetical protein
LTEKEPDGRNQNRAVALELWEVEMVRRVLLLCALAFVTGCQPRQPFLGTWQSGEITLSINSNGDAVFGAGQHGTKRGTWRDLGDGTLEAKPEDVTKPIRTRWWVSEDGKTLTLTDLGPDGKPAGETITYVKQ